MPGYTHLQHAQPILLSHHLLAYVSMLERDEERFDDCLKRVNRSPLGAGALAGTSFPIDRKFVADSLGMIGIIENSIDAVSDRDVHIEFLSACAITMMHLSRFDEELILWTSREWQFAEIGDEFTTGSSIMPQKKNSDMAELVRGKTGRVYGDLISLLTTMKGLPLAYNRDMQEDKEPLFDSADTLTDCLKITTAMLKTVTFNQERFEKELQADFTLATELADYLVRKGLPFRKAHAVVGAVVQECLKKKITLNELSLREYKKFSKFFSDDVYKVIDVRSSLERKRSAGPTSHQDVRNAIEKWKKNLLK
jgi:argininosuccinate lyase